MTIKELTKYYVSFNVGINMNPENKPVEELKLRYISHDSDYEEFIPALDPRWCKKDYIFTLYSAPPIRNKDGEFPMGSKEDWLERLNLFIDDVNLLLQLDYHRFWSEVMYDNHSLDGVSSFLQHATPFYLRDQLSEDKEILIRIKKAQELVFRVLIRLTQTKESENMWMKSSTLGNILYNNFIISFPQLMEISLIYASDNFKEVTELMNKILEIQPKYLSDIKKSAAFVCEVFYKFEAQLNPGLDLDGLPPITSFQVAGSSRSHVEIGKLLYLLLDISYSLITFIQVCPQAAEVYHDQVLEPRIANFYENTIPVLKKMLDSQHESEENQDLYMKYDEKLNISRHNLISSVHGCLTAYLSTILQERDNLSEEELKSRVDIYLNILTDCLSDHIFMRDYNSAFPVHIDLNDLTNICPDIDSLKCEFIYESISSLYDLPRKQKKNSTSAISEFHSASATNDSQLPKILRDNTKEKYMKKNVTGVELQSLITEVKDILPHLGDGFVSQCLEYFNYVSADVINAVLENNIPESLSSLDLEMPFIPPDEPEESNGLPERANVFDNDEFDIMRHDQIDTTRIHRGKRQQKHKDLNELLDDKTHVKELRDMYSKLSLVEDVVNINEYEDEYDDTYDDLDVSIGNEGETETEERRAFVIPRVLQQYKKTEESEYDSEDDKKENEIEKEQPDHFIENPAVVRARVEQRRQEMRERGNKTRTFPPHRDVVGRSKGQGQDKEVIRSREFKNTNKASRGNHNRRAMAAKKRRQGMLPS